MSTHNDLPTVAEAWTKHAQSPGSSKTFAVAEMVPDLIAEIEELRRVQTYTEVGVRFIKKDGSEYDDVTGIIDSPDEDWNKINRDLHKAQIKNRSNTAKLAGKGSRVVPIHRQVTEWSEGKVV